MYTIGEVSKMFNLPISTLRYYDKEGILGDVDRNSSGIRKFDDKDIETIKIVECLKKSGMQLKDIKIFLDWCKQGDSTIKQRHEMFLERREDVKRQIANLEKVLEFVEFKCDYYLQAKKDGTEKYVKESLADKSPLKDHF